MKRTSRAVAACFSVLFVSSSAFAQLVARPEPGKVGKPVELKMQHARSVKLDLRKLPYIPPTKRQRFEREAPPVTPVVIDAGLPSLGAPATNALIPSVSAAAPAPIASFDGLDYVNWGAGHPPDTDGDVGPQYFIQTINTSIGIYNKSTGAQVAAFTLDTFMSQGRFGNLCDTNNFGDAVVLYDSFEDRWVVTDFAFQLDASNNVINPPGNFQCFAVSMTGDPVSGGWHFYSINTAGGLGDYPKFGIWPDGIYMSANMFDYAASGSFQNVRLYAFNKAQMYAGAPTVQVVSFDAPSSEFTLLPSNARLQTGTPPAGAPNYVSVVWNYLNAISVYKFHVDWSHISLSSLTGPFTSITGSNWANPPSTVATQGGGSLDTLAVRLMVQNQYSNISGSESLWNVHTVQGSSASQAVPRYYQTNVTGGTVAANTVQAANYNPDALSRWMGSVAVNRLGDMAMGYSVASTTMYPAIRYAGRLAGDAANTISLTDRSLIEGTGTQNVYNRWGDYSAMSLDPDGCTFWYTNEYYTTTGLNYLTRIGSFVYPGCTAVTTTGTIQGTVTVNPGGSPISGATVQLGARVTTTNASGVYSFTALPPGTYPTLSVAAAGYTGQSVSNVSVTGGGTTTQNFSLTAALTSGCFVDTAQADFQAGVPTNVDLTTVPGSVTLVSTPVLDQQNTTLGGYGGTINSTTWGGQTFTPATTGQLTRADINLFCSSCTGTTPDLTLSVRATSGGLPTGADLATGTITGFSNGAAVYYSVTFSPGVAVTAGTMYALVVRPNSNPSAGTYAITRSGTSTAGADVYAGGTRVIGSSSGTSWSTALTGGVSTDAGFKVYIQSGYVASGNLVSSMKDANPAAGMTPSWSTISWTATVPPNTTLQFQAAASNSASGPFNFVGPDGTAGTFFTSGSSLAQFNGLRYLEYKTLLSTTNSAATPTLNDVTICFSNIPIAPTGVVATATSSTSVSVTWNAVGSATSYKVFRKALVSNSYTQLTGTPAAPPYVDTTAAPLTAYLYVVHAVNASGESADSAPDLATTVPFTDDPLVGGTTFVLATHLTEIRTAVNAVHVLAGLGAVPVTDATLVGGTTPIKAVHITDLRSALDAARTALSLPALSYTDPTMTGGVTAVKAVHFQELRNGTK